VWMSTFSLYIRHIICYNTHSIGGSSTHRQRIMNNTLRTTNHYIRNTGSDSRVTSDERRSHVTQINILSQNAAKQFFLSFPAETTGKIRNFDLLFCKTNPICKMPELNVSYCLTKDYENARLHTHPKNKPNQTQFKPKTNPIQSQFHPNQTQNKPKTNPIKANFCTPKTTHCL